ncbi:TetR/AcrR family transcriptional regulator [Bradyrhizobium prioriisuperbiae]|uniref:TetR/AcrR family transcriptional regulator n=1 Tax=Bradyrhizobium prioriisuperbiae TaxID=2854389 RepID=UPI0028E47480|nr:TetR/AcrR family transcriptional regulator [Bradyrhizobium prioritasuperba]
MPVKTASKAASAPRPPRGRRTRERPDGRTALLAAATHAFASLGFDAADLRSIAAAAGVAPNLVRVHFGSKAELWQACLDAIAVEAVPVFVHLKMLADAVERPLMERLAELIVRVADFFSVYPDVRDFVARHASGEAERAARVTDCLIRPAYESAKPLFTAGIEAGIVRSRHPALFFALLNSAVNQPPAFPLLLHRLSPEIAPETARAMLTETIVATLLHSPAESRPLTKQ